MVGETFLLSAGLVLAFTRVAAAYLPGTLVSRGLIKVNQYPDMLNGALTSSRFTHTGPHGSHFYSTPVCGLRPASRCDPFMVGETFLLSAGPFGTFYPGSCCIPSRNPCFSAEAPKSFLHILITNSPLCFLKNKNPRPGIIQVGVFVLQSKYKRFKNPVANFCQGLSHPL